MNVLTVERLATPRPRKVVPANAAALVQQALSSSDVYAAAAVYAVSEGKNRERIEAMLCGERRTALLLARWEHTPAPVLQLLSHLDDEAVHVRIGRNPGTQPITLTEHYGLKGGAPLTALLARHRHTPPDVLEKLAEQEHEHAVLRDVCKHPAATERALSVVARRFPEIFDSEMAMHEATPPDELARLYGRGDPFVRAAVVSHPRCPLPVLTEASAHDNAVVLCHVGGSARISPDVLQTLAGHADVSVRRSVAVNPLLPSACIKHLMHDESEIVRRAIAVRKDLSAAMLDEMAADADHWVRQWVARNPALPRRRFAVLARDGNAEVRRAVARNPRCPRVLLRVMAQDANAWVRAAVAYQTRIAPPLLRYLADDREVDVLSGVAANPRTPQWLLCRMAASPEADVRRGVILNPRASRRTLLPLLQDPYPLHRLLLAGNQTLKDADRWSLHEDPDPSVRFSVFRWLAARFMSPALRHAC